MKINKTISSNRTDAQIVTFMGIYIVVTVVNAFCRDYIDDKLMFGIEYKIVFFLIGMGILLRGIFSINTLNKHRTDSKK